MRENSARAENAGKREIKDYTAKTPGRQEKEFFFAPLRLGGETG